MSQETDTSLMDQPSLRLPHVVWGELTGRCRVPPFLVYRKEYPVSITPDGSDLVMDSLNWDSIVCLSGKFLAKFLPALLPNWLSNLKMVFELKYCEQREFSSPHRIWSIVDSAFLAVQGKHSFLRSPRAGGNAAVVRGIANA